MSHICISINAVRFPGFVDLQDWQGNPLITPVGHLYLAAPTTPNIYNDQAGQPPYQQPHMMGGFMGNTMHPMFMNKDGAFIFDPASPNVAHGTLHHLREIIKKNYPEEANVRFISAGSQARLSVAHQGYNEIRDLGFTETINVQVRFKKADGIWYVHNRADNGWYRPTVQPQEGSDFAPFISKAVVVDVVSDQIQIEFDEFGQMIGAAFLEDDDGNLTGFAVHDSNKIFEFVYPGEQMVFTDD